MKKILFVTLVILLFNTFYAQDVKVSTGKLSVDGLLWLQYINTKTYYYDFFGPVAETTTTNTFTRRVAFIGLTANLNSWASCRLYFDVANMSAFDIYAMYKPNSNLSFTFGQFKLPLGVEMLTKSENLELIEYSLIGRTLRAPKGTRDIGIQGAYKHNYAEIILALVNGNGRNVLQDDDNSKCVVGRFIIKPLQKSNIFAGANYYFGKYDTGTVDFSRFGFELNYTVKPIILKAELLLTKETTLKGTGYYVQAGYNWMWLQPILRYSAFKYEISNRQNELVLGLNFRPLSDNFKVMLNYKYKIEKTYIFESETTQKGLLAQVQFAF